MAVLPHGSDGQEPHDSDVAAHASGPSADVSKRYRLIKPLGGTPGDVLYLARHLQTGALIELRVFTDDHGVSDGLVNALRRLAADAATVSEECPGIAALSECERTGEVGLALAMVHQDGTTLRETIRREGGLDPDRAISIALKIAEILQQAHTCGLVHGGLRPENVVLIGPEPTVVLTQYGVDRILARWTASRRRKGAVVKTHSIYHPPEQAHGDTTEQGDIYALGALLYEMLAGSFPRTGIASIRRGRRGPLKKRRPGFTPGLERIVTRTLDPKRQRRPDIQVLCNDLRAEIGADERPKRRRRPGSVRWAQPRRASLMGGGLIIALGLGIWATQAYLVPHDTRWTLPWFRFGPRDTDVSDDASRALTAPTPAEPMASPSPPASPPVVASPPVEASSPPPAGAVSSAPSSPEPSSDPPREESIPPSPPSPPRAPTRPKPTAPRADARREPAPAHPREALPAPRPSAPNAPEPTRAPREAGEDSGAVIDWLLKEGRQRR